MRLAFMGTPKFALPSLARLLDAGFEIPVVVTVPDSPQGRGRQMGMSAVKEFALTRSIPVLQPEQLDAPDFLRSLAELGLDLAVVVAFRILPKTVYTIPAHGAFNLHASLLPKYRGAAPINWAIMKGETETGVTTFFLDEKVDTGSIILQKRVVVGKDETAGELSERLSELGADAVLETVRHIETGVIQTSTQQDELASKAPKIHKEDCRIPWSESPEVVHNFVRGLSPVPCAWTMFRGKSVRVYRTRLPSHIPPGTAPGVAPGEIAYVDKELLLVGCGGGSLISVREIQQEGKKRMEIAEFLRGFRLDARDGFR